VLNQLSFVDSIFSSQNIYSTFEKEYSPLLVNLMAARPPQRVFYEFLEERLKDFEERLSRMEKSVSRLSSGTIERFNEITAEIDFMNRKLKKIKNEIGKTRFSEKIRKAEEEHVEEEMELIRIPVNDAKELVREFIESHPGSTFSEIFLGLKMEPDLVLKAVKDLAEKKEIRGFPIE
jgi:Zn-finger domain-containing protein